MKYNKIFLSVATIAAMSLSLGSCSYDEVDSAVSPKIPGDGVYFAADIATSYDVEGAAGTIEIPVYRKNASGAKTVELTIDTVSAASNSATAVLSFPTSVTFEADTLATSIAVSYSGFEYDDAIQVKVTIPSDVANQYAVSDYTFVIDRPQPWSEWKAYTTGVYTYAAFYSGTGNENPIYRRVNTVDPTQVQFRQSKMFNGVDMVWTLNTVTNEVTVPAFGIGYINDNEQEVHEADVATFIASGLRDLNPIVESSGWDITSPSYYDPENGIFYFYMIAYVWNESAGRYGVYEPAYETMALAGFEHPDYSVMIRNKGVLAGAEDQFVVLVKSAKDVAFTRIAAGATEDEAYEGIVNGTIDFAETSSDSSYVFIPVGDLSGEFFIVAVPYSAEGEPQAGFAYSIPVEYYAAGEVNPWQTIGLAKYTDDLIISTYSSKYDPITYQVEIREHTELPGYFRLKSPYGAAYPYNEGEDDYYDTNMEIVALNPAQVYVPFTDLGINWNGDIHQAVSFAYYYMANGYSAEEVAGAGYFGTYADSIIAFETPKSFITWIGDGSYYSNSNGAFKVDFHQAPADPAAPLARRLLNKTVENAKKCNVNRNFKRVSPFKKVVD